MSESQGFFGAIMKPFAGNNKNKKSTNLEEKRNCSSPRDLPHDATELTESDSESYLASPNSKYLSPEKKHSLQDDEESDDQLDGDFAPVMPTKPFTKRGSFMAMFRKSNSQKIEVDPKVLEAAERQDESEETETEDIPTVNDNNKGTESNKKNSANDAAKAEQQPSDEKSPEVTQDSTDKQTGGFLGMFFKPKETADAGAAKTSCEDYTKEKLEEVPSKDSTAATTSVTTETEQEAGGKDNEKNSGSEDNTTRPEDGLGFFGKLFQRKDLPKMKEDNGVPLQNVVAKLGSEGQDVEDDAGEEVEKVDSVESMYHSAKEVLDLSDQTNSSEEALAVEENTTNEPTLGATGLEKVSMRSDDLVQSEDMVSSRRSSSQKRSSFISMFFDSSTEDVPKNQTETEDPTKETLVQEACQNEGDSVEVNSEAQYHPEETGLEFEAEAGDSKAALPLDDPYVDDNEKGQKEQICCSFPFC